MVSVVVVVVFGLLVVGYLGWQKWYVETTYHRLACEVGKGLRIVQISDLHGMTRFWNGSLSRLVNRLDADLVCITGDLASRQKDLPRVLREVAKIRAKHGIFFVPGNYEREEAVGVLGLRKRMVMGDGYRGLVRGEMVVLENQGCEVQVGEKRVWIYGFDNSIYGNERFEAPQDAGHGCFRLLLAHSPNIIHLIQEKGVQGNLLLVGHTHGGQVRLWGRTLGAYKDFHVGVRQLGRGWYFAISRGLGTVKVPFRVQCLPEIAVYDVV